MHHRLNFFEALKFDNLEEISLECDSDDCFGFMENNQNVKKLELDANIGEEHVIRFGTALKKLEKFSLSNRYLEIKATAFIQLIDESEHLTELLLEVPGAIR